MLKNIFRILSFFVIVGCVGEVIAADGAWALKRQENPFFKLTKKRGRIFVDVLVQKQIIPEASREFLNKLYQRCENANGIVAVINSAYYENKEDEEAAAILFLLVKNGYLTKKNLIKFLKDSLDLPSDNGTDNGKIDGKK